MSKPRIYANCKAGCLWETIHREEFERSAAIVAVKKEYGVFRLEPKKTYRIRKTTDLFSSDYGFIITLNYTLNGEEYEAVLYDPNGVPAQGAFGTFFNFEASCREFLNVKLLAMQYYSGYHLAWLEFDGKVFAARVKSNGQDPDAIGFQDVHLIVACAEECYLVNEHAEILARGLPEVTEADNGKILQVVNGTWQAVEIPQYLGEVEVN